MSEAIHDRSASCASPDADDAGQTPQPTVNDILRWFAPAYLDKYRDRMSLDQIKVLGSLTLCRTEAAGAVVYRCCHCARLHQVPRSCGNRHCPSCQGAKAKRWCDEQQARLLPCPYFMLTFTVPAEIRGFIRSHPRQGYRALFEAAYQSMAKLAKDPKFIGSSKLGMTGVLHTWGRDLSYHPHVHFIVPGGAISESGTEWLGTRRDDFFLPVMALSKVFRAKFRALMKRHGLLDKIDAVVWTKGWNVNCQAVGDGRSALRYLSPYVFRVAIGNHRIVRVTRRPDGSGTVTLKVKPSGQRRYRELPLSGEEFVRRFLQHVLPTGFQKVRHFGFMHKRSRVQADWLSMLVTVTLNLVYVIVVGVPPPVVTKPVQRCRHCGGELVCLGFMRPSDPWPVRLDTG